MGATFNNRWEENQKNLYSKEAEEKARGKNKKAVIGTFSVGSEHPTAKPARPESLVFDFSECKMVCAW